MAAIAFTYDITSLVGRARFFAGDTDGNGLNRMGGDRTRTDSEIVYLLGMCGNEPRAAAAMLLEGKAAEYALAATQSRQGELMQDFRERSRQCLEVAERLRKLVCAPVVQSAGEKTFTSGTTGGAAGTMDRW